MEQQIVVPTMELIPRAGRLYGIWFGPSDREAWLGARKLGVGGSDVAAIIGAYPAEWNRTPRRVWLDKTGQEPDAGPSWDMEQGTAMEPAIAARWARSVGADLRLVPFLRDREHQHRVASLDRIAVLDDQPRVCEVKWSRKYMAEVPDYYAVQVQWYLHLTGLPHADVVVGGPWDEPYSLHVPYDPDMGDALADVVDHFWLDYVMTGVEPPPTTPEERKHAALRKLARAANAERVADEEAVAAIGAYQTAAEAAKVAEAGKSEAQAAVYEALARMDAARVRCPDGVTAQIIERVGAVRYGEVCKALGVTDDVLDQHRGEPSRYLMVRAGKERK